MCLKKANVEVSLEVSQSLNKTGWEEEWGQSKSGKGCT